MKAKTMIILFCVASNTHAGFYGGISQGYHYNQQGLNDIHPFIGYETSEGLGAIAYLNSFDRLGLGIYERYENKIVKNLCFVTKIGFTTGYAKKIEYKGKNYDLSAIPFISKNIAVLVVPSIEYKFDESTILELSVLGNSINLGISINF